MMLESTLGNLLSKRVGPSFPTNNEDESPKGVLATQTSHPEAEVRIVFRLVMEEQIVIDGKVEEVKQLESEEVSRVVSRIAWDGNKSKNELVTRPERTNALENPINDPSDTFECKNCSRLANGNPPSPPQSPTLSIDYVKQADRILEQDSKDEESNTVEYDPQNSSESIIAQKSNDNDTTPLNVISCTEDIDQICETTQFVSESNSIQKTTSYDNEARQQPSTNQIDLHASLLESDGRALDIIIDSQSIAETLNDCVNSVDLESRQLAVKQADDEPTKAQEIDGSSLDRHHTFVGESKHNNDLDLRVKIEDIEERSQIGITHISKSKLATTELADNKPAIDSQENLYNEEFTKQNHSSIINETIRAPSKRKSDDCLPKRRRNTSDDEPSLKRVRQGDSKDRRRSRNSIKTRLLCTYDNEANALSLPNEDVEDLNGHLACHSKVFAKWSDNHFYPGTILQKPTRDRKFVIGFFDGAQRNVVETDLIPLCNINGKQVRVSIAREYCVNAIVHEQKQAINDEPMFDVEYQQDGVVRKCVPLKDIFLTGDQGAPLINQPFKADKNPDESMFAGVDLDNIVHVKRSRRLQELEDMDTKVCSPLNACTAVGHSKRKRSQYNMRNTTSRSKPTGNTYTTEGLGEKSQRRSYPYNTVANHRDTPSSSCSPDTNIKSNLQCPNSNPPSEGSNSTEYSNTPNAMEMGQEFYFDSSSPHRAETSLLL